MKKSMFLFIITITGAFVFNISALADDQGMKMDHSQHMGEKIHESKVEGYQFAYHLLNMEDRATHHLMVYIMAPDGGKVENAKVGYLVSGPDGTKQKMMAMGMKDAYGADLEFKQKGSYTVKIKAVTGDKKLLDEFTYEVD